MCAHACVHSMSAFESCVGMGAADERCSLYGQVAGLGYAVEQRHALACEDAGIAIGGTDGSSGDGCHPGEPSAGTCAGGK